MKRFGVIFQILPYIIVVMGLKEKDPKCRYRVHLPEASWHTAYDVCVKNNMTLARMDTNVEVYILAEVLEDVDKMMNSYSIKSNYSDVWIGAIMRTSNKESMHVDCKSFPPRLRINMPKTKLKDEMVCMYFNLTDKSMYVDDCERNKTFVCENKNQAPSYCMMISGTDRLRNNSFHALSTEYESNKPPTLSECTLSCIERVSCYAVKWTELRCESINYYVNISAVDVMDDETDKRNITHKSFFVFSKGSYKTSKPKPISEWCPEMTPKIIQKKIKAIQTNLTINRKNTTKHKRTLISAPDDRTSARNLGLVGVLVICLVAFVIVSFDFISVFQNAPLKRSGIKEE